jgi:hypothetical protein
MGCCDLDIVLIFPLTQPNVSELSYLKPAGALRATKSFPDEFVALERALHFLIR